MASKDTSSQDKPASLVSFPSLSCSLHTLPMATNLKNIAIHPNMYAHRAAESEAKLQRALARTPSSFTPLQPQPLNYNQSTNNSSNSSAPGSQPPSCPSSPSPGDREREAPLMMRTKSKYSAFST